MGRRVALTALTVLTALVATFFLTAIPAASSLAAQTTPPETAPAAPTTPPAAPPAISPRSVSFPALLDRLTDLDALALPPQPGVKHVQYSSYDRKSHKGSGDEKAWFANGDCGQYLRVEESKAGKEYVMVDTEGPGVVVRIWSANPRGTLKIYLDGNTKPFLACPMADLLDGKLAGYPVPLAGVRARGHNLYFPIPFARHLKMTSTKGGFYYQVNVLTYPKGTPIRSLSEWTLAKNADRIQEAAKRLTRESGPPPAGEPGSWTPFRLESRPDTQQILITATADGPAPSALYDLVVAGLSAEDLPRALRQTLLVMTFDGEETVRVPLGDFFGCGPRAGAYRGLAMGAEAGPDGPLLYCRLPLPFRYQATVALENRSGGPLSGRFHARLQSPATLPADALAFHAVYREAVDQNTRPMRDMNYLDVKGQGRFVGCTLTIRNPVRNWWGEGDEKVFVDGEKFPSVFGTGTEDYFGYAWCCPELFSHPYHAQPVCDGPRNYGLTTVTRFQLFDPIPFQRSLRFDLELWHWKECTVDYCTVAWFYAAPGARDAKPFPADATPHWQDAAPYVPPRVEGAIEAETLAVSAGSGKVETQQTGPLEWSNDAQVWWMDGETGGKPLAITFDAPEAGRYRVLGRFTLAPDYGRHQLVVNDQLPAFEYDFYRPGIQLSPELELGVFDLKKKGNVLKVQCVGRHQKARDRRMFGLDYIKIEAR